MLRQKRICFVLLAFISKLLVEDQFLTFVTSSSSVWASASVGHLLHGVINVLSSEYLMMEQLLLLALRSSVNMVKMLGPPTVPWEQPVSIASCGNCVLLRNRP